jgi:3-hydroxy acid dehydrogenase / malonic semialdehyde reductase
VKLDVSKPDEVRALLKGLPQEVQNIDVLVNNAYFLVHAFLNCSGLVKGMEKVGEISEDDIRVMMDTNVTGLINVCTSSEFTNMEMIQAILPSMKSRNTGTIINIGSIAGRVPYAGGSVYCATKAAVQAFTDALRHELISTRIRVVNIDPGQVETEFSLVRFRGDEEKAKKVYEGVTPLTGIDVAEVIVFAASRNENVVIADVLLPPFKLSC